jgi:hypothetical protein
MEIDSMTSLLQPDAAAPLTTAIARMFGKTVKLRRCPATVSAPSSLPVVLCQLGAKEEFSQGLPRTAEMPFQPLELDR